MVFFLSKILWHIFNPFNLILLLVILGIILTYFKFYNFSKILFFITFLIFFITGFLPTGNYLIYLLERNFHEQIILPTKLNGIIILSGATNPFLSKEYNQISLNDSAERLIESAKLIKLYPEAEVFFAGGSGSLKYPDLSHATVAKKFYENSNININRIYFENKSRNTYENILFFKKKFSPKKNEKWIIVTSAFHLKRSLNIASKMNIEFMPYATDYKYRKKFSWKPSFNFLANLSSFQRSSHEWVGLISYYLMGRTSNIF